MDAFRADAANYYPGINALTLGRLWEHVTDRKSKLPLDPISAGLRWCIDVAVERDKDYWSLATRAELALVDDRKDDAIEAYEEAAALAVTNRDRFALDSSSQQLDILGALGFRPKIVTAASLIIDRAEQQLEALGFRAASEPKHVVVFSGHMIDNPAVRGPGKAKPPRFPPTKIEAVAKEIRARLDRVGAGAGDLGLCGGASGGDLLFAEACLERGMLLEIRLARAEPEFLAESVTFADPDHRWEQSFMRTKANAATLVLVMPDELGPPPEGVSVHDRCNRWILYSALSGGLSKTSFVTLWNGEPGDGPGGTQAHGRVDAHTDGPAAGDHRPGGIVTLRAPRLGKKRTFKTPRRIAWLSTWRRFGMSSSSCWRTARSTRCSATCPGWTDARPQATGAVPLGRNPMTG